MNDKERIEKIKEQAIKRDKLLHTLTEYDKTMLEMISIRQQEYQKINPPPPPPHIPKEVLEVAIKKASQIAETAADKQTKEKDLKGLDGLHQYQKIFRPQYRKELNNLLIQYNKIEAEKYFKFLEYNDSLLDYLFDKHTTMLISEEYNDMTYKKRGKEIIRYPALVDTITEKITKGLNENIFKQGELFPAPLPAKDLELKRTFALNFGSINKIEKEFSHLLPVKLTSGKTLQAHLNELKEWFNNLRGKDLGLWIKLFAFAKAIKEFAKDGNAGDIHFKETTQGRYTFRIKQNKDFYMHFIRPDKKTGFFTTKAKSQLLKWFYDNQKTITFPMLIDDKLWETPISIFQVIREITNNDDTREIIFAIETSFLESEFKDYVELNINEIDATADLWEEIASKNELFAKMRLNNFMDLPIKFLLTLKNIYNRKCNFQTSNYLGNMQTLSTENLNEHLGNLSERLKKHLDTRNTARKREAEIHSLLLETTFNIAMKQKWILSMPNYDNNNRLYKFNINRGYFDTRNTAIALKKLPSAQK
jgi:hypothetical protein